MARGIIRLGWKIAIDIARLLGKEQRAIEAGAKSLAKGIVDDTRPYVPYATGRTDASVRVQMDGHNLANIIWESPYANIIYQGERNGVPIQFNQSYHKNAQKEWFEAAKAAHGKKWVLDTQREIRSSWGVL